MTVAKLGRPTNCAITWIENASLEAFNTMGLRATARLLARVADEAALVRFLEWAGREGEDFLVIGRGSNVVFADDFLDRTVLVLEGRFAEYELDGEGITAGAATPLARLVGEASKAGLSGLEYAWGIPGTLGGALAGNAGTDKWAIGDVVDWVEVFDRSGAKHRVDRADLAFAYRRSPLSGRLITRAGLALRRESRSLIAERIEQVRSRRKDQPSGVASAGCIFKNPDGDSAGRLIEAAGLKGMRRGGAMVSKKHANFIINDGGATGADVLELIEAVRCAVRNRFGIELETEVQIVRSTH